MRKSKTVNIPNVEIFRVGTWTDSSGRTRDWTAADLDRMAGSYNPADREAPLVAGHPKTNHPALGWVDRVRLSGDRLLADFKDVVQPVADALRTGRYKKRSISVYPDGGLRHVGLLGAAVPAVPGLKDIAFQDGEDAVTYEFSTGENTPKKEEAMELAEALAKIKELEKKLAALESGKAAADHAAEVKELRDQVATVTKERDAANKDFAAYKAAESDKALEVRVGKLVDTGRIKPADRDRHLSFARAMPDTEATMEFAAPDGKAEKVSPREAYLRDLEALDHNATGLLGEVATGEYAGQAQRDQGDGKPANYASKI